MSNYSLYSIDENKNNITKRNSQNSNSNYSNDNIFKLNIFYNGKKLEIDFEKNKEFYLLYEQLRFILLKKNININTYDILYKNEIIASDEELPLSEIIHYKDNNPSFILRKKKVFIPSKKDCFILIEKFPSFMDLSQQINNFINYYNEEIVFNIDYKDNLCKITFKNIEISFSFVQFLTKLKFKNKLYKNLKVKLKYNYFVSHKKSNSCNKYNNYSINSDDRSNYYNNNYYLQNDYQTERTSGNYTSRNHNNLNDELYLCHSIESLKRKQKEYEFKKKWANKNNFLSKVSFNSFNQNVKLLKNLNNKKKTLFLFSN
jgi:hypothetical protein